MGLADYDLDFWISCSIRHFIANPWISSIGHHFGLYLRKRQSRVQLEGNCFECSFLSDIYLPCLCSGTQSAISAVTHVS